METVKTSQPIILDYHVRRRRPWVGIVLLGVLCALVIGGGMALYLKVVQPRLQRAEQLGEYQRRLDAMLNYSPLRECPVAAIVDETVLKRDPNAMAKFG